MLKLIFLLQQTPSAEEKPFKKTSCVLRDTKCIIKCWKQAIWKRKSNHFRKEKGYISRELFFILRILKLSAEDHRSSQLLVPSSSEKLCAITLQLEIETFKVTQNPELLGNGNSTRQLWRQLSSSAGYLTGNTVR